MPELQAIDVSDQELNARVQRIAVGDSFEEVVGALGGMPFQDRNSRSDKREAFWRFRVGCRYDIYKGEFEDDRLTFGSIIPNV